MTVPTSNITLSSVQSEWGGSNPISLSEYYRGGIYVPNNFTNTGGVPSSGAISLSQLGGTYSETNAVDTLNHFWNYRGNYFRRNLEASSGGVWPGDSFNRDSGGGSVNRYVGTVNPTTNFDAGALIGLSKKHTVIYLAAGSSATISSYPGAVSVWASNWGEISLVVARYDSLGRDRTSYSGSYTRSGGNSGSWSKMIILNGWWDVAATVENPVANTGVYYDRVLPSGRCALLVSGNGYNGDCRVTYSGTNNINGSEWWYNNSTMYFCINNTWGNQTMRWTASGTDNYGNPTGSQGMFAYNHRLFELYKYS